MDSLELKKLRQWFLKNAALLPWRSPDLNARRNPYAVWISETMLQQTQVSTVKDYFTRWMERFPDIQTLAAASEEDVFKFWQGLGYYSRARNILRTAQIVGKELPSSRKELEALPGIGAYTAGAILSLAFHQSEAILDGNLVRIFSRFYSLDFLPTENAQAAAIYWDYAKKVADSPKAYLHNEALMELGRTICKIKNPQCQSCPLRNQCKSFAQGTAAKFPPAKKHIQKDWHGTILVVESKDNKILAVHGEQKFFCNQYALPHFETVKSFPAGIPVAAESLIDVDQVLATDNLGNIRHNITVHKINSDVLHIRLKVSSAKAHVSHRDFVWLEKAKAPEVLANSFSTKALKMIQNA
ncbi:MAG: A/G-specific adenine glycosylase [Fibrobacter sp.]|nr:A/G-specific adenine glycosylase [Fibrobacter sp.]